MKTLFFLTVFALLLNCSSAQTGYKLSVDRISTHNATTIGIQFARFHLPFDGGWGLGFCTKYEILSFSDEFKNNLIDQYPDLLQYKFIDVSGGADFLHKLFWKIYFVVPINVHFGEESIVTTEEEGSIDKFFIGASGDLMVMFIPTKFGITAGFGVSGKVTSANCYKNDFGFKIEFGIKF